ncbi:DUF421 domain-containing protein [Streptosporangium sp. NBC_01756]|uniref:DUF421 domain-containing protein n=1 Tax=Streptosporangium sp. NBC_01756 TaxID=2975950 RepID=UPI002DDAF34E|nr:YetF domain-containing protein [Streptosporangium sp. NBC_01756]WSC84926.1 DUF421 domain-containing protein [Streptosporangium sp. NBC_01756]
MWQDILISGIPLAEKAVRTVVVYLVVVILLRVVGKRDIAQLDTFDLVVMLLLSNVVQNAIIGPDNSVSGAVFGAAMLLAVNAAVVRAIVYWPWLARLLEGSPVVLARNGAYQEGALRRLALPRADLDVAIKRQGGDRVEETALVTLEPGGALLVRLRPEEESASAGDVAELSARLDRIERHLARLVAAGAESRREEPGGGPRGTGGSS